MFGGNMICVDCSYSGKPKKELRGSTAVEVILWILLIVPGVLYSIWRRQIAQQKYCERCGSPHLVSVNSDLGRKLIGL